MARFTLIHSPLVGPATWSWVADELEQQGHQATVPSTQGPISDWSTLVDGMAAAIGGAEPGVLAGHSGAGPLLPVLAARLERPPQRLVFVDAGIPPASGSARLMPAQFLETLTGMATDGVLPPWSEWFGPETMAELVPDATRRAVIVAELPRLPLSYFDASVPIPAGWDTDGAAYLLLSEMYREDHAEAQARGWPSLELPRGAHLDLVTRPAEVAEALIALAG